MNVVLLSGLTWRNLQEVEGRLKQKVVSVAADLSLPPALQERVETGGQSAPAYGEQRSNKNKQVGSFTYGF